MEETTSPPVFQPVGGAIPLTNDQWKRGTCFSCGLQGHGVNRCSRMDVSFPYLLPGWSVDVRNGQYAELDGTVSREKRDGSGERVSLPDYR